MQQYNINAVPLAFGLHNTGAICWLNSLLQSLLSCPSFNLSMMDLSDDVRVDNENIENMLGLYVQMISNANGRESSEILRWLVRALIAREKNNVTSDASQEDKIIDRISFGAGQECSDEGFTLLLDLIDSVAPEATNNIASRFMAPDADGKLIKSFNYNSVKDLFTVGYAKKHTCEGCGKQVTRKEYHTRVEIPMLDYGKTNLNSWLIKHRELHTDYKCDCGHKHDRLILDACLIALRSIILVVFIKFAGKYLAPYPLTMKFPSSDGKMMEYNAVAKIEHWGTQRGGHYAATCMRRDSDNFERPVYRLNDSSVSVGDMRPTPETFMVFYHYMDKK